MDNIVPEKYPIDVVIPYPEASSRGLALAFLLLGVKAIVLVPHMIALAVLGFIAGFVMIFAQFAVLFTGKYPKGMFDFVIGLMRWQLRANAYMIGLNDTYPPFRLQD